MNASKYTHELFKWLKEVKGVTKITIEDAVEYCDEFDEYRASLGDFSKVDESNIEK